MVLYIGLLLISLAFFATGIFLFRNVSNEAKKDVLQTVFFALGSGTFFIELILILFL